jgi:electron transfer flavoprotein alpha subunit
MKIAVLVKQVPDVSALQFDPATRRLRREGVRLEVSSFDVRALVKAVELRSAHGGEVVALTMGPPQAREALLHCLALGADRAVHLVDQAFAGADTLATARALARALGREPFDLVLAGRASVDAETAQVGPEVAELLGWPQVTSARSLAVEPNQRRFRAEREVEGGTETIEGPLPAVVTCGEDVAPERYPRKAEREAAATKPIEIVSAADLASDPSLFGEAGSPTRVEALEIVEERREGRRLGGELGEAIRELVRCLRDRGLLVPEGGARIRGRPFPEHRPPPTAERAIWVVAEMFGDEPRRVTFELLGAAASLGERSGGEVVAVVLGHGVRRALEVLSRCADRVLVADDPILADYSTDAYAAVLGRALASRRPRMVLFPSTYFGRDLAPRIAARFGLGLTGDCMDLTLDPEGHLVQWKPAFGGNVVAPILSRTLPEMATVRPGMLEPVLPASQGRAIVEELPVVDLPPIRTVVVERKMEAGTGSAALDEAETVIGVGKGIGGPAGLGEVQALAAALGGAALAVTRDVADAGWLPRQHQVGLTGRAIAPRLYLAIGIRGAFEHVVGLRRAGTIVAIDKNPKAPIFDHADLGIVADWAVAVPLLRREIEAERRSRG